MSTVLNSLKIIAEAINPFLGVLISLAVAVLLVMGYFTLPPTNQHLAIAFTVAALFFWRLIRQIRISLKAPENRNELLYTVDFNLLLIAVVFMGIQLTGGPASFLHPLVYVLVAFLATFTRKSAVYWMLLITAVLELSTGMLNYPTRYWPLVGIHVGFIGLFGVMHDLFLRLDAFFSRKRSREQLLNLLSGIEEEAAKFRLDGASGDPDRSQAFATHFEIHGVLQDILRMLRYSTSAYTAALLWQGKEGKGFEIVEKISDSPHVIKGELDADQGHLHTVIRNGMPIRISQVDWKKRPLAYYQKADPKVQSLIAVPVLEGDKVRGVLCLDRKPVETASENSRTNCAFTETEMALVQLAATQILRAMANENLYRNLTKSRTVASHLAQASQALSQALGMDHVVITALEQARSIVRFDIGALLLLDPEQGNQVAGFFTKGCAPEQLLEDPREVLHPGKKSLTQWVLQKGQMLSYGDFTSLPKRPTVFAKGEKLDGMRSILILPLTAKQHLIGVLVMAAKSPHYFGPQNEDTMLVLANQIAVSIENARIYDAMERMAITDGLTGLYNRRFFMERFEEMLDRAGRQGVMIAVILGDIDHFKRVNDTYGHPVGDMVLRNLAEVFRVSMRKIDLVGRYGGEEFIIALEGAGPTQAQTKLESVMEQIRELEFHTEVGNFNISSSFGLAVFPSDGDHFMTLIERADEALYEAKRAGRDQLKIWGQLPRK